jgi:hypothetical protein
MSAPPSPGIAHAFFKNRDLPDVLDIPGDDRRAASDGEDRQGLSLSPFEVEDSEQVLFSFSLRSTVIQFC